MMISEIPSVFQSKVRLAVVAALLTGPKSCMTFSDPAWKKRKSFPDRMKRKISCRQSGWPGNISGITAPTLPWGSPRLPRLRC